MWLRGWNRCELTLGQWAAQRRLEVLFDLTVSKKIAATSGRAVQDVHSFITYQLPWGCTLAACPEAVQEQALLAAAKRNIASGLIVPLILEDPVRSALHLHKHTWLDLRPSDLAMTHLNKNKANRASVEAEERAILHNQTRLERSLYDSARTQGRPRSRLPTARKWHGHL